jgi:hypothetical protein
MAGNGKEWTRRVNDRLTVPVENANPGYTVELRGRTYRPAGQRGALRDPLPYWEMQGWVSKRNFLTQPYLEPQPDIGFRVMFEP